MRSRAAVGGVGAHRGPCVATVGAVRRGGRGHPAWSQVGPCATVGRMAEETTGGEGAGELVRYAVDRQVAVVTLASPANRNALSRALLDRLAACLDTAFGDDGVRAVLLAGEGRAFSSGADLREARSEGMEVGARRLTDVLRAIVTAPKPVVAKVAAPTRAGGTGLVAAADVAIAADTVTFAFTEARLGLAPAVISMPLLPRLLPRAASRYFLTSEAFDAAEAARIGLVTQAVPADDLDAAVDEVLDALRRASPQGLRETKALVNFRLVADIGALGEPMAALSARLFASEEGVEGMTAFAERRPPTWQAPPG